MKKISLYIIHGILLAAFLAGLSGCDDSFLEVDPKGRLIAGKTSDYELLLNNLELLNIDADAQILMGDEVVALEPHFSGSPLRHQRLFRWEDDIYEDDENAPELNIPLQNLYTYNKIIQEVMESTEGTEAAKKSIWAEALAGRAWTYFLLINYYGKPYDATTAATDPGFPLILEAEITATNFSRASVQAVYDQIIEDLTTAIPDLPAVLWHRLRMSRPAAEALLGKVYVYMGRFEEALPLLNQALTGLANASIPVSLYDLNITFATDGAFLPISLFGPTTPTVPNHFEVMYAKQSINWWSFINSAVVVTPQTFAMYGDTDLRRNFFVNAPYGGSPFPAGFTRRRGPISVFYGVQLTELYLLRAECKARLNDLPGALSDLEFFRRHRMPVTDAAVPAEAAAAKVPLLQFIMDERLREFAVQGYRWFDMRRLSVDPLFGQTNYTHTLYNAEGNVIENYSLRAERLTLRLPGKIMNANPGMENNP
jgi:starch-binding outer membrane protein, SusD/RagB family